MPEEALFHKWIYLWHMPVFFLVSGILLAYKKYVNRPLFGSKGILISGINKLLKPYCIYAGLLLLTRWLYSGFNMEMLRWQVLDFLLLCGIGATWFLPCLFFCTNYIL